MSKDTRKNKDRLDEQTEVLLDLRELLVDIRELLRPSNLQVELSPEDRALIAQTVLTYGDPAPAKEDEGLA